MADEPMTPHEFEKWRQLAISDPKGFEAERRRCIERFIASAPAARQERLRRLQWRIDHSRRTAKTPLAGCIALSKMMWESVVGRNGLLDALHGKTHPRPPGKVLPLGRDNRPH